MVEHVETTYGLVGLDGLKLTCIIGELPYERERAQEIIISLRVSVDFAAVAAHDNIEDALDYTLLVKIAEDIARKGRFRLLETMAWRILDALVTQFHVPWAWIRIQKPSAFGGKGIPVIELERGSKP